MLRWFFEMRYLLGRTPWDSGITPPELQAYLERMPPGSVLELGCGTGTNAISMAHAGWVVTGVDFSARAIRKARRKLVGLNLPIRFHRADVTDLSWLADFYDLGLDIGCYHSLDALQRIRYVQQLAERLKHGADLLLYSFTDLGQPSKRSWPQEDEILRDFRPFFEVRIAGRGSFEDRASLWLEMRRL